MATTRYTMTSDNGSQTVVRIPRNSRGVPTGLEITGDDVRGTVSLTASQLAKLRDFLNRRAG